MIFKDSGFLSFFAVFAMVFMVETSFSYAADDAFNDVSVDEIVEEAMKEPVQEPALSDSPESDSGAAIAVTRALKVPMFFSIQEGNENDKMARKALERVIQRAEMEVGRHIPLGVARADLNGDGVRELFVRLLDQDLFCRQDDCQVYGFAVVESGFIKIADFQARTIDIMNDQTGGTKDLLVKMTDGTVKKYVWDGKHYALTSDQKEADGEE